MSMELDWLNARYYAAELENVQRSTGNDGLLVKRKRRSWEPHTQNIPPEWLDTWISRVVTQNSLDFGVVFKVDACNLIACVPLRQRVHEWMLGIEE